VNRSMMVSLAGIIVSIVVGAAVAVVVGQGGANVGRWSVMSVCMILAFGIQWVAFVPAYLVQSEKTFDLIGALTSLALITVAFSLSGGNDSRSILIAVAMALWAIRLGAMLSVRVHRAGRDRRFADIKPDFARFLMAWTLQGLWVFLSLVAGLTAITTVDKTPIEWIGWVGLAMWLLGFTIEVIADHQKYVFRADPANADQFITSGLWAWSRHPNYFGEILLWSGIAVAASPALANWQLIALVSPFFVFVLLRYVSGVSILERAAESRWGDMASYRSYRLATSVIFPRAPRR